jgi:iron complex outermembrane receptor protein
MLVSRGSTRAAVRHAEASKDIMAIIPADFLDRPIGSRMRASASRRRIGLLALSAWMAAGQAFAQEPAPPSEPAPPPEADSSGAEPLDAAMATDDASLEVEPTGRVEEVVITVDRRAKDIQKYSGTASAFSETQLSRVGIQNVRELSSAVPGLQIGVQEGNTEVFIRGVGSDNNTELGDPADALHLDGVYIPRPRGVGSMFFDIARVEVNSGPQGTLRGRNALGGTINIVSVEPQLSEFGANAEATFGTFAQRRYQGMVNIPLGDVLALRLAGFYEVHDPYWQNASPLYDITPGENADTYAFRVQLRYQPTNAFKVLVAYDYTAERGTGYLGANFYGPLTATQGPDGENPGYTIPFDVNSLSNPRRTYLRGLQPSIDMWHQGVRGTATYDLGPLSVEAVGSYRSLRYQQVTGSNAGVVYPGYDVADVNADVFGSGFWDSRSQSLVAELRAFAPDSARLRWTAGAFFFDEDQQVFLGQTNDPASGFAGGEFNMPSTKGNSIAGYVDATFDVAPVFRVLGGVRVTHETKSRTGGLWQLLSGVPETGDGYTARYGTEGFRYEGLNRTNYNAVSAPAMSTQAQIEDRVNLWLDGVQSFGARDTLPQVICNDPPEAQPGEVQQQRVIPNPDGPGMRCSAGINPNLVNTNNNIFNQVPQNNEVENTFVDWRAGVEYDLAADSMLYLTASTGHKAGGFNDTSPVEGGVYFNSEYDPESILAFELGSKNVLADRRLRLNGSAFYYSYTDYVFQTIVAVAPTTDPDDPAPSSAVRQNTAAAHVLGLDLDVTYALPAGLEAEVHALFMNAEFGAGDPVVDSRIGFGGTDNYEVELEGHSLPRAAPFTINYALSQFLPTSVGAFNWVIQGQTVAKHYFTVYNGEGSLLPPADGAEYSAPAQAILDAIAAGDTAAAQKFTDVVPARTRFDLGGGWKHVDGRLSISGFINNVFNIAYPTSVIATPNLNLRFFNPPRTAGVRVRVDW